MDSKGYYYGNIMAATDGIPLSLGGREFIPKGEPRGIRGRGKVPDLAIIAVFCFLMGRVIIFEGMAPFGIALFAVVLSEGRGRLGAYLGVLGGMLSLGPNIAILRHLVSMGLILLIYNVVVDRRPGSSRLALAFLTTAVVIASNLVYRGLLPGGVLSRDYVLAAFEGVIIFAMVYIFSNVVSVTLNLGQRRILSGEEMISMGIFTALIIAGMWDIRVYDLSLKTILSILLIMVWAYIGGVGLGSAMGILVGLILSVGSGPDPMFIAALGICGLMAGTFKGLGKVFVGFAFLLAHVFMSLYMGKSPLAIPAFHEILISIGALLLIPKKTLMGLGQFLDYSLLRSKEERYYINRIQELTAGKLNKFSGVFKELATAFGEIAGEGDGARDEVTKLLDLVSGQVCTGCALYSSCWDRNFCTTYNGMFDIIDALESGKKLQGSKGGDLLKRCIHRDKLVQSIERVYELYKANLRWKAKLGECRQLVAKQLHGVSRVVGQLAKDVDIRVDFKKDIEESISLQLDKAGIRAGEVLVMERPGGGIEVNIQKKNFNSRPNGNREVEDIVSRVIGKRMTLGDDSYGLRGRDNSVLRLKEAMEYRVSTGIARMPGRANGISGDSYSFNGLSEGKYMLALSDGMGHGTKAAKESGAVISLLENFLEAGFDMESTIQTINSTLLLRSKDEIFATVDLCILDLITGEGEITKIGAVPTFIKRGDHVEMIKGYGLPIGILDSLEPERAGINLRDEDMIIMVTDGVLDNALKDGKAEEWLIGIIQGLETRNPQEMADKIMKSVLEVGTRDRENPLGDDMTIMVTRVWKPLT